MMQKFSAKTPPALAAVLGFALAVTLQARATTWVTACSKPWVFFDLGNTLVDTSPGRKMEYIPGALEYLHSLKQRGYRIGLITNVPEKWGPNSRKKIHALKNTMMKEWTLDPNANPLDWRDFSDVLIFVPPRDEHRKPAPYLFRSALSQVFLEEGETRCKVVFQGEDAQEVAVARQEGMIGYQVGSAGKPYFLPLADLEHLVRN
jgi:FMN phosphatase YigB (HAD superfamily)